MAGVQGGGQGPGGTGPPVGGHGHHYQAHSLPYQMHHSLIQHLSELHDLRGGHLPSSGGGNSHSS